MKTKGRIISLLTVLCMALGMIPLSASAFNPQMYAGLITQVSAGPTFVYDGRRFIPLDIHIRASEDLDDSTVYFIEGGVSAFIRSKGRVATGVNGLGNTLMRTRGLPEQSNQYYWTYEGYEAGGKGVIRYNVPLLNEGEEQVIEKSLATGLNEVNALTVGDQITFENETVLAIPGGASSVYSNRFSVTIEEESQYPKDYTQSEEEETDLSGIYYQLKANDDGTNDVRALLVADQDDVLKATAASAYINTPTLGDLEEINITRAYKSVKANGKKRNAGRGKVFLVGTYKQVPTDCIDGMTVKFKLKVSASEPKTFTRKVTIPILIN
ncbi:MAG: hypothetical protein IJU04_01390 [Ruminococcus sp.]|nr:hypothetical protein [Ruminococcus sp.]